MTRWFAWSPLLVLTLALSPGRETMPTLALVPGAGEATPTLSPDSGAGVLTLQQRTGAFIHMLGDGRDFAGFIETHMSEAFIEKRGVQRGAFIFRALAQRYHGRPARIESLDIGDDVAVFRLSNDRDEWAEYELFVEPEDASGRIGGFNARIIPRPPGDDLAGLDETEIVAELDRYLQVESRAGKFAGSVVLARDGRSLYDRSFGLADREREVPNTGDTQFNLASLTKSFTALAIGRLVERGKLKYADTVGAFLPDLPSRTIREQVTIHQLLTHTSGLDSFTLAGPDHDEPGVPGPELATLKEQADFYATPPLVGTPGESYVYSNAGPVILGRIVEVVSGRPYAEYVNEEIFGPAGMSGAGFSAGEASQPAATGYRPVGEQGGWRSTTEMIPARGNPATGAWASSHEMLALARALLGDKLVERQTLETLTTGKVEIGDDESYGYGFTDNRVGGVRFFGHTGHLPGWSADFSLMPGRGYAIIVLSNSGGGAREVGDRVRHMLATMVPADDSG